MSILLRLIIFTLMTLSGYAVAGTQTAKQISCKDTDWGNIQCTYEVKGQEVGSPDATSELYGMTSMPYALCSSAVCKVREDAPNSARCICKVYGLNRHKDSWRKASVGPRDYLASQPEYIDGHVYTVTSNFSFANFARSKKPRKRVCKSSKELSWANCFGVRCEMVSGSNMHERLASCDCPIMQSKAFISMGPTSRYACKLPVGKVWSGATAQQGDNDKAVIKAIYNIYYPNQSINRLLK